MYTLGDSIFWNGRYDNSPCKYLTRKNVKLFAYNQS